MKYLYYIAYPILNLSLIAIFTGCTGDEEHMKFSKKESSFFKELYKQDTIVVFDARNDLNSDTILLTSIDTSIGPSEIIGPSLTYKKPIGITFHLTFSSVGYGHFYFDKTCLKEEVLGIFVFGNYYCKFHYSEDYSELNVNENLTKKYGFIVYELKTSEEERLIKEDAVELYWSVEKGVVGYKRNDGSLWLMKSSL